MAIISSYSFMSKVGIFIERMWMPFSAHHFICSKCRSFALAITTASMSGCFRYISSGSR